MTSNEEVPGSTPEPVAPQTSHPPRYYGRGLPYLHVEGYPGKIIAIEGTDGVGRSTQISLLREWLEVQGYGVIETGWTRSELMQPTIDLAKSSNTLNKLTFVLLYATDFADRLEKEIAPALKAGFVVLADRYIFTALARAAVRNVDRAWLRSLYGFAIIPDLVFYLKLDADTLTRRVLQKGGMDFWESGMDLKLGDDIYDNFRAYQGKLLREYNNLAEEFYFRVLDARQSIDAIQTELRRQVGAFLAAPEPGVSTSSQADAAAPPPAPPAKTPKAAGEGARKTVPKSAGDEESPLE
jgi:dTMP kinase